MSLRHRLATALIGLSVAVVGLFALGIWAAYAWLESSTLDRVLGRELGVMVQAGAAPTGADAPGTGLRYYRPAQQKPGTLPAQLDSLGPGSYRDFALPGGSYHVLVQQIAPGDRAYITYDVKAFELRERWLRVALASGMLGTALLAWLSSAWIARRTLRPLDALVARIRALKLRGRGERLESRPRDGELDVIVQAFNERLAEIDALVVREQAFAASASHELRTPLAAIRGAAEVLASQSGAQHAVLARIERAVTEATGDLDALLALSLSRELPAPQRLQLHEMLPGLAEPYLAAAQAQQTAIEWNLHRCELLAPAGVVSVIFTNLLRNALRAAPGGQVRVELAPGRLIVADNGHGIAPRDLAQVFEPGVRRSEGGSGMGLYIAGTLAERCGFRLSLHSEHGVGTSAEVHFHAFQLDQLAAHLQLQGAVVELGVGKFPAQ